jgi:hypothetical protein
MNRIWQTGVILFLLQVSILLIASVDKKIELDVDTVLSLPTKQIEGYIPQLSPGMLLQLKQRAFDREQALSIRWKALVLAAKIGGSSMSAEVRESSRSSEWYMRSASLTAAAQISVTEALSLARKLVNDKALVVRSAAVDILGESEVLKDREILWKVIEDTKNKRKGQSLWIRTQALNWLIKQPSRKDIPNFIRILKEDDSEMNLLSVMGLEKISDFKFGSDTESISDKKQRWLSWWELNGKTRTL